MDEVDEAVAQQFASAQEKIQAHEEARRAAAEKELKQQLQRLEQLMDRATKRATAEDLTLREADRIAETRRNLEQNVALTLALESMLVTVASGRTL